MLWYLWLDVDYYNGSDMNKAHQQPEATLRHTRGKGETYDVDVAVMRFDHGRCIHKDQWP